MRITDGGFITGGGLLPGEETELRGYVNAEAGEDFTGDTIWVSVNMGNDAAALFQNGTAVIRSYTEDWVPGGNGRPQADVENGLVNFMLQGQSVAPASMRVEFGIRGVVSGKEGTSNVILIEEDSIQGVRKEPLSIPVSKAAGYKEVSFFMASRQGSATEPSCFFDNGEPVLFQWDGMGAQYRILANGADGPVYEGGGSSFLYQAGIYDTTVFILEVISQGKTVQYKTLTLRAEADHKVLATVGVQDGKGLNFAFELLDDRTVSYWSWMDGDMFLNHGETACKGSAVLGEIKLLWADRLPDGRVVVVSACDALMCYQIQEEAGKAGFGLLHIKDFSGGDRNRYIALKLGILNVCMAAAAGGIHMFVHYIDNLHMNEAENQSGIFYGMLDEKGSVDFSRVISIILANANGYSLGDWIGVNVCRDKLKLYYKRCEGRYIDVYDLDDYSSPVTYAPEAGSSAPDFLYMQGGGDYGVSCLVYSDKVPNLARIVLNEKEHKYAMEILRERCGLYYFNSYTDESGRQNMFYLCQEYTENPDDYPFMWSGFADDSGKFKFEMVNIFGNLGCSMKHKAGAAGVFVKFYFPPDLYRCAYIIDRNRGIKADAPTQNAILGKSKPIWGSSLKIPGIPE